MTVKVEETKPEDNPSSFKQKCKNCMKISCSFKSIVIMVCVVLVLQQIAACIGKLINRPITTYTHFDYNKTIAYPSISFCREPPYKQDVLEEYGLYAHPRYTSTWRNFNFSSIPLDELWENITYNADDFFVQYGLNKSKNNVHLTPVMGFMNGRCYTMSPKSLEVIARASQESGYSITLQHYATDMADPISVQPPGYHVHIHYVREPFTEVEVYNGGLVDYLYVNTGETVHVKLKVDEYVMISDEDSPCTYAANYSANACTTKCVSDLVAEEVGCAGPWMKSDLPYCNNYADMRDLIVSYMNLYVNHKCESCPRFCRSYLYNGFVTDRQKYYMWDSNYTEAASLQTQIFSDRFRFNWWMFLDMFYRVKPPGGAAIYVHFNNMMVSVYEERYNYDWNLFLSDLGGSVGFLLGLSVLSLINIIENVWIKIIIPFIVEITKKKEKTNSTEDPKNSKNDDTTPDKMNVP